MSNWTNAAGVLVMDEWLTSVPEEDRRVEAGQCPYQTGFGGWGDPLAYCGADRSPDEGDWPYCRAHAARIRDDRGHGGFVG